MIASTSVTVLPVPGGPNTTYGAGPESLETNHLHCRALLRISLHQRVKELEVGQAEEGAETCCFGKENLGDHAEA